MSYAGSQTRQSGLSMIELMIATVISLFLVSGVLSVFSGSKGSFHLIEAEARMHDNALFAIDTLNNVIRHAGYASDPRNDYTTVTAPFVAGNAGDVIQGTQGAADTITVWYQGDDDGRISNCLGSNITSAQLSRNRFQLNGTDLQCVQDNNGAGASTQPLISGITDMQILYGIDTIGDGSVNRYVTIDTLGTPLLRDQIVGVKITLTLQEQAGADTLSKTFTTAIALRNKI